jgi:hypothetical protein
MEGSEYMIAAKVILKEFVDFFTQDGLDDIEYQFCKEMINNYIALIQKIREEEKP